MKHIYKIIPVIGLLFVVSCLQAQKKVPVNDTLNLNEILITGKKATTIRQTNIVGKVLELQNPHDGGEIFKNQPGFGILKKGNYGMEPVLRAFKFGQLNVQFDGGVHSTNACPNRMDPAISQISVEDIEKVEVINGPYSVRFGPVFGGIINIISKQPRRNDNHPVSASADMGYQSNGNNFYSNMFTQVVKEKYDLSVNAGYKNYGNYESGSGQVIASSFKRTGYTTRLGINPSGNQRLQLTMRQSFARDVLYAGLPMDVDKDNSSILSLDYGVNNISEAVFSLKFKFYGSYITHLMTNKRRPNYKMVHATTPLYARNIGGRTEIGMSIGSGNILYVGLDFQHIGKDGSRTREVFINPCTGMVLSKPKTFIDKVWQNSKKNDFGLFLQNKFTVSKSLDWLIGLRADMVSYAIDDPAADFSKLYDGNIRPKSHLTTDITTSLLWEPGSGITFQW
ncbi:TonB-dependent receptor, partial [hydrothermal vent metagenome]